VNTLLKVSEQTIWQIVGKVITSLSTLFILGFITRTYGEEGTGIFTLALVYLSFFYLLADLGINAHLVQELKLYPISFIWPRVLGIRIFWSFVLIMIAPLLVFIWPNTEAPFQQAVLYGSLAILGTAIFASCNVLFQSNLKYNLSVFASSLGAIFTLLLVFLISKFNLNVSIILLAQTSGWLLAALVATILVKRSIKSITPVLDFSFGKKILKEAWPVSLALLLNLIYFRADSFIISLNRSFTEVGVYNLAYQIFQSALVLPTFIMNGLYPLMISQFNQNKKDFNLLLKKSILIMLGLSVLGVITTLVFAPLVIQLVGGQNGFTGSTLSLRILSLGLPAFFVSSVLMWVLVTMKSYKTMLITYLVGLSANIILNLILVPQFSYIASSWITVFSEYLILILQLIILFPRLKQ